MKATKLSVELDKPKYFFIIKIKWLCPILLLKSKDMGIFYEIFTQNGCTFPRLVPACCIVVCLREYENSDEKQPHCPPNLLLYWVCVSVSVCLLLYVNGVLILSSHRLWAPQFRENQRACASDVWLRFPQVFLYLSLLLFSHCFFKWMGSKTQTSAPHFLIYRFGSLSLTSLFFSLILSLSHSLSRCISLFLSDSLRQ